MLLAAAFVAYAGPFTASFRVDLIKEWINFLTSKSIPMTPGISDPLKVSFFSTQHMPCAYKHASTPADNQTHVATSTFRG